MSDLCSEFKIVKYKKKRKSANLGENTSFFHCNSLKLSNPLSTDNIIRRIRSARKDISDSIFFKSLIQDLIKSEKSLEAVDIVCYGIGQFSESVASRFQLALLLEIKDLLESKVSVYDPLLNSEEKEVIELLGCVAIETNEEGKRKVDRDTLFFAPHCPKQLINNLLWKNWSRNLSKCIVIGNSLKKIVESNSNRALKENLLYLFHASTFVTEIAINNNFKFSDVFNDLSIHFFAEKEIESLPDSIFSVIKEPVYLKQDIEFVTNSLSRDLNLP